MTDAFSLKTGKAVRYLPGERRLVYQLGYGTGFAHIHHKKMLLVRIYHYAASPLEGDNLPFHLHHTAAGIDVIDFCFRMGMAFKTIVRRKTYPSYGFQRYAVGGIRKKCQQFFFNIVHRLSFLSIAVMQVFPNGYGKPCSSCYPKHTGIWIFRQS